MSAALTRARKLLQPRRRRRARQMLAEGAHVLEEALAAGCRPLDVFVARASATRDVLALADRTGAPVHDVSDRELAEIADTRTPQGVVAVLPEPAEPQAPFAGPGLWLLLDRVRDPGNAGTLLRAAEAFGARGVLALRGTVDLWAPRTLRAGQGAHFHLEVLTRGDDAARLAALRAAGGEIWAADADAGSVYDAPPPPPLCALALGNEAEGLSEGVRSGASRRVAVPQRGRVESLNVALAGAVLLSWLARGTGAR